MKTRFDVSRIFDSILRTCGALSGVILVAIMLMVCAKVVLRYGLGYGWIGVDQISGTFMLYMTFLGTAWVLGREDHVTIDFLVTRLSPATQRLVLMVSSIVSALVCLVVFIFGTIEVVYSLNRGILIAAELEFPRAVNLVVIPFGCLLLFAQFLRRALLAWRSGAGPVHSG